MYDATGHVSYTSISTEMSVAPDGRGRGKRRDWWHCLFSEVTMTVDEIRASGSVLPGATTFGLSEDEVARLTVPYQMAMSSVSAMVGELAHSRGSPIEHVSTRLKSLDRIVAKARRVSCPVSAECIRRTILDIAGVRIICGVISDVYRVARLLSDRSDLTVVDVEDYIANPKPNGYKSLHVTVQVPLAEFGSVDHVPVEVQIRTRAMDYWASFEHRFFYASDRPVSQRLAHDLTRAADAAHQLDVAMQRLHSQVAAADARKMGHPSAPHFRDAI